MNAREIAKKYRLAQWTQVMQERSASGMNIKEYCKASGLRENVYFYWQRKLREASRQELLTVKAASTADISTDAEKSTVPNGWAICKPAEIIKASEAACAEKMLSIEIGIGRISVGGDVDAEQLTKVCRVLMSL